mgnify:CR=1 FL=1
MNVDLSVVYYVLETSVDLIFVCYAFGNVDFEAACFEFGTDFEAVWFGFETDFEAVWFKFGYVDFEAVYGGFGNVDFEAVYC